MTTRLNEKYPDGAIILPLKWRDVLERLAKKDHRDIISELIWLIEHFATGRLVDSGDGSKPRVSLEDRGVRAQFPDVVQARSIQMRDVHLDSSSPDATSPH